MDDQKTKDERKRSIGGGGGGRRIWLRIRRLALVALSTYLVVVIMIGWLQARLIYFPTRAYDSTPRDVGLTFESVTLEAVDGVRLAAWYIPHADARATVLFFHGNAGNISDRLLSIDWLHDMGLNVLILDYRGYGASEGRPSEEGLYRDAEAAWDYLIADRGERSDRVILFGRSLGGAVAIELAIRRAPALLVVESTFTRLADVGKIHYPFLPVDWVLRHRYESIQKVARVSCPKLLIHGRDDELIPLENALELFRAASEPKAMLETPGGHNEAGFTYSKEYADQLRAWLESWIP